MTPSDPTNSGLRRSEDVCAVLVTWHPDLVVLAEQLAALAPQVGCIVLVDNASDDSRIDALCAGFPCVTLLTLTENHGLAHGLNVGIQHARTLAGVTRVLLMDQDSVPAHDMLQQLGTALTRLAASDNAAAVGACFRDDREADAAPFVRIRFPFNRKLRCTYGCTSIGCDFLITSGCLIPLAVLDAVGGMDDALFIDNVDLDWCFRAMAKGYTLHGVCAASLRHRLGDARQRLPGMPRGVVVHSPRRLFYMMRNRVLLYRRAYTPRRWIAQDVPRLVVKFLLFALLVAPRRNNVRCMLAGLRAGIAGRSVPPPLL